MYPNKIRISNGEGQVSIALYKLIGFYDELTPLQIEKVINDYKLKYD